MFQLLQPIWLFALTTLIAPVIVHLWNQRPGKTLRVGSIALVAENAVSKKKNFRLTELLLLLLRCLLLACVALALAAPVWKQPVNNTSKGWVLMSRQQPAVTYQHFKPTIDSLLSAGMEFHYFEEGFAKVQLSKAIEAVADTAAGAQISYRQITLALNELAPASLPLYVFTDNYLQHFSGPRSAVSLNLHWFTYTPDTVQQQFVDDTTAMRITIVSGAYTNDARYLKAAIDAIQQFSKRNIITKLVVRAADTPGKQDWLFWLAPDAIPAGTTARRILQYAPGKEQPCRSFILPADATGFNPVNLYTSIVQSDTNRNGLKIYWKDGFGRSLLASEQINNALHYWLYTHIDPAWNELPWSDNFPQLLYTLLYDNSRQQVLAASTNKIIIDSSQLTPVITSEKVAANKQVQFSSVPLNSLFWLLAFLLFFAERRLSFHHRKTVANG